LDQAFSSIDTAVLLADTHILDVSLNLGNLVVLNFESLEAVKSAGSLSLDACLHVESLDKALSVVDGTVLLADADISVDGCGQAQNSK
jgi:hypothetical protein